MAIKITFADKSKKSYKKGTTLLEISQDIGLRAALAAKIDDKRYDLSHQVNRDSKVQFLTFRDEEGKEIFHHSSAHLMAAAVLKLYPKAKPTIGPSVEEGFYYDFDMPPLTPEDLKKIEAEMQKLVKEDYPFLKEDIGTKEALKQFKNNPYKKEMIKELKSKKVSFYTIDDFTDLCRGPHVPSTKYLKAFKLTKVSSAYWRADSSKQSLQRIYGISFPDKKELRKYLHMLEEAEKRDHRKIGKRLELFSFHEEGPGFVFFQPKGMTIINILKDFWREEHRKAGYVEIQTPIILNKNLWLRSGHWEHYKENMYFTKIDKQDYAVKPMNCPGGILVYKNKLHSYRELPLRIAEMGLVHRHELSGVLSGLFRARAFTQDDAHLYVTEKQLEDEIIGIINLTDRFYKIFGFDYHVELSTKPEKCIGSDKMWETAEKALEKALKSRKVDYKVNPGEGAFYGPKIDFHIKDCLGRTWQCATIQCDFAMPEKFDLTYEGQDGKKHRPVMLHRVVYGSIERFLGILIEHYAGRFPLWLSPVQTKVIAIADRHAKYAEEVYKKLFDAGIRVELDTRAETVSYKVRDAQLDQINYIGVVGDKEEQSKSITIRTREGKVIGEFKLDDFIRKVKKEVDEKK